MADGWIAGFDGGPERLGVDRLRSKATGVKRLPSDRHQRFESDCFTTLPRVPGWRAEHFSMRA